MTENELRMKIADTIRKYYGAKQGSAEHKAIVDRYNSHKPLPRGYKMTYSDYWCACTVSSIAIECGCDDIIPIECSCNRMIDIAKSMGIWVERDDYKPKIADIVLYDWNDNGVGDCIGQAEHIGFVTLTTSTAFVVHEGNKGKKVDTRVMAYNGKCIRGFITPNYASKCDGLRPDVDIDIIAREVLQGKYGNGIDRRKNLESLGYDYITIQKRVNELLK